MKVVVNATDIITDEKIELLESQEAVVETLVKEVSTGPLHQH